MQNSTSRPPVPVRILAAPPHYTRATRLFHMALTVAITTQLASSFFMVPPMDGDVNLAFQVHEYSGLAALTLAAGFWLVIARRRLGTPVALLWPWFSESHRTEVATDASVHWQAIRARTVPVEAGESPLASAVHGLGLATMTGMAVTGGLFYIALLTGAMESTWASVDIWIHGLLSKLVWVYLIGHAGVALLHHLMRQRSLRVIWRLDPADTAPNDRNAT